jgi:Dolichyl-phosphate-mannose-protein mannosyltransferase
MTSIVNGAAAKTTSHDRLVKSRLTFSREWISFLLVLGIALIPILYVPVQTGNNFLSDDLSMYWTTKWFGETGHLYFKDDLTESDLENLMHPRGFITHEGVAVTYNFLGLPVLYGIAYAFVGDKAEYLGAVLAGIGLLAIWGFLGVLFRDQRIWAFPMIFLAFPVLYYLGRPYMNIVPSLSFFFMGIYFLLLHHKEPSQKKLAAASVFFSLGIFCRYPDVVFVTSLVAIVLWQTHGKLLSRKFVRDMSIYVAVVAVVFGIPVLIFNQLTYGSPFTYGYGLFNGAYYPDRGASGTLGFQGVIGTLGVWALPGGLDIALMLTSVKKYFVMIMPLTLVLAGVGYFLVWKERLIAARFLIAYTLLFAYVIAYNGSGAVWGTQFENPTLGHTLVRYWLLAYLSLALLGSLVMLRITNLWARIPLLMVVLVLGIVPLFHGNDSLTDVKGGIERGQEWVAINIVPYTEENAVIYAGRSDKLVLGSRRVAAWFNSADESFFDPVMIASSMNRVNGKGVPSYIVHEPDADLEALDEELGRYGLTLRVVGRGNLSAVVNLRVQTQEHRFR